MKTPKTATGGKRKRTPGDKKYLQHKWGEQEDLETQGKKGSSGKRKNTNERVHNARHKNVTSALNTTFLKTSG